MAYWETVLTPADSKLRGRRLIPNIVDENARCQPDRICFSYPRSHEHLQYGFQDISWRRV